MVAHGDCRSRCDFHVRTPFRADSERLQRTSDFRVANSRVVIEVVGCCVRVRTDSSSVDEFGHRRFRSHVYRNGARLASRFCPEQV
jgi:hypothetical protein